MHVYFYEYFRLMAIVYRCVRYIYTILILYCVVEAHVLITRSDQKEQQHSMGVGEGDWCLSFKCSITRYVIVHVLTLEPWMWEAVSSPPSLLTP